LLHMLWPFSSHGVVPRIRLHYWKLEKISSLAHISICRLVAISGLLLLLPLDPFWSIKVHCPYTR
jgi:hypothetical protein